MKLYYNDDKCPKCGELTDHRHGKVCKKCHAAYNREYHKEWQKVHATEMKEYKKEYYKAHATEMKEYKKEYHKTHAIEMKEYKIKQKNSEGKTLSGIRIKSNDYLFRTLKHNKLDNYEIHHCFGYEDYKRFIYIPKSLHLKIHQYLRDNQIDAKNNHYRDIVELINTCEQYTYIHC